MRDEEERRERKETSHQPRSRTSSTSSQQSLSEANVTKQVGITVYRRKTSNLNTTSRDRGKRAEIRHAITKGEAKITWENPKAERQQLINAFAKGRVDMEGIEYH